MAEVVRILSISHTCVVPEYRVRHAHIAREEGIDLTLLTPESWWQFNRRCAAPPRSADHQYNLILRQPFTWGISHHGLRNASHVYPGLRRLIRDLRPDILELWAEPFFAVAWQAGRALRALSPTAPIIFFSAQNVDKWRPPPYSWFEKWILRNAQACYAMNHEVVEILVNKGWRGRNQVLPLGVDQERYDPADRSESLRKEHGLQGCVVGFLGKLAAQKGVLDLLQATAKLGAGAPFSLLIIGNGELAAEVEAGIQNLACPARWLPAVPHQEVPRYLGAMDVVVMPSLTLPGIKEQFGRVAVEAMAAGRAVVVSDSGELPKVVGDAGVVFPEGDVEALTKTLRILVENESRREELRHKGLRRVRARYNWKVIAKQQLDLYRELLRRGS